MVIGIYFFEKEIYYISENMEDIYKSKQRAEVYSFNKLFKEMIKNKFLQIDPIIYPDSIYSIKSLLDWLLEEK